jgi:hypothetical protein
MHIKNYFTKRKYQEVIPSKILTTKTTKKKLIKNLYTTKKSCVGKKKNIFEYFIAFKKREKTLKNGFKNCCCYINADL